MHKNFIFNLRAAAFTAVRFLGYVVKFYPTWLVSFDETLTRIIRSGYPFWTPFFYGSRNLRILPRSSCSFSLF